MKKKEFKSESKRLLELMINSIYTNKEIFLRELISNASDAMDKLKYLSLTDKTIKLENEAFIKIDFDKEKKTLTITDNGCGMNKTELENNLGTIAESGSLAFKKENSKKENLDIIGQFGVGFYSAFMVSNKIVVETKKYNDEQSYVWESSGSEGYTIIEGNKFTTGTTITLYLKEEDNEYLDEYRLKEIVKKYSDYIRYPIKMEVEHEHLKEGSKEEYEKSKEIEIINSMVPIWKKSKNDITEEEYNTFYNDKFFDYDKPLKVIHSVVEGTTSYKSIIYIPAHAPYDFYTKEYEKGLELYSNGVMIMEKCSDLLPDYFSFAKGLVDSEDLSLNISRELLQHDKQLKVIAKSIEGKIKKELENMLKNSRDDYEKFFKTFGIQLKFGVYNNYGANKEDLKDLLLFYSSKEKKLITLKEYISRMKENQEVIYFASGETIDKIDLLPQVEIIKEKDFEILYLTEYVDEFAINMIKEYDKKNFMNVCNNKLDLDTEEEKKQINEINEKNKEMLELMKESIGGDIENIRFTHRLKNHPVCLVSDGEISVEMEKVINAMPTDEKVKASKTLEINENHEIVNKLKKLYDEDKEQLKKYAKVLYAEARLIEGLSIDNPTEISNLICEIISK
ncbi:MAG: molecular chaperone HtpG [Bacilli bacterium]